MYSTVSSLQDLLSAKEAKGLDKAVHLAGLQCLAILCDKHGQKLASSMLETLGVASKYASRYIPLLPSRSSQQALVVPHTYKVEANNSASSWLVQPRYEST